MEPPENDVEYDPARIFVKELASNYYSMHDRREELRDDNRVVRWADTDWDAGGGQIWNKDVIGSIKGGNPVFHKTQSLQTHIIDLAPEGTGKKHYHQNEALMYILNGRGYERHDGKRYEWEPGDLALIHGGCVHEHYSADPENPARALIIKPKPLYLFLHLIDQQVIDPAPEDPVEGWEDYEPEGWGAATKVDVGPAHERALERLAEHAPEAEHPHSHHHEFTEARMDGGTDR